MSDALDPLAVAQNLKATAAEFAHVPGLAMRLRQAAQVILEQQARIRTLRLDADMARGAPRAR